MSIASELSCEIAEEVRNRKESDFPYFRKLPDLSARQKQRLHKYLDEKLYRSKKYKLDAKRFRISTAGGYFAVYRTDVRVVISREIWRE